MAKFRQRMKHRQRALIVNKIIIKVIDRAITKIVMRIIEEKFASWPSNHQKTI